MQKSKSILISLLTMMILPIIVVGGILSMVAWSAVYNTVCLEMRNSLSIVAHASTDEINLMYPGDVKINKDGSIQKGENSLADAREIIDAFQSNNQIDINIYYEENCIMSTVDSMCDSEVLPAEISKIVMDKKMEYYSKKLSIGGVDCIAYAVPMGANIDGCVMAFQDITVAQNHANTIAMKIVLVVLITVLIAVAVCIMYANKLVGVIQKIQKFLGSMADRDSDLEMHEQVLERRDEIGDIGRSAVSVQKDLSKLINCDPLTELYNRRACLSKLSRRIDKSNQPITIVMGDIDFFKQVNDTYGHECGDVVLKYVAQILAKHMENNGFAARWGGEEFLLIFDADANDAKQKVEQILNEIREHIVSYDNQEFGITMTFGVQQYQAGLDMDTFIKLADDKLYHGKENGRNCIVM